MNRRAGVAAIRKKQEEVAKASEVGRSMETTKINFVRDVLDTFKGALAEFAHRHRAHINSDPEFRLKFHQMCLSVGVDPLSSSKGFWSDSLGLGGFYYELGVVIIQVCMKTRIFNGGLIAVDEVLSLIRSDPAHQKYRKNISEADLESAVRKLEMLGSGFCVKRFSGKKYLQSVPVEINTDHEEIFEASAAAGADEAFKYVTRSMMVRERNWQSQRFDLVILSMLRDGLVWIDCAKGEPRYYFPQL